MEITTAIEQFAQLQGAARTEAIMRFAAEHTELIAEVEATALTYGALAGAAGATPEQVRLWSVATDLAKAYRRQVVERAMP